MSRTEEPTVGMRVRFTRANHVRLAHGRLGTINAVNPTDTAFCVAIDGGGFFGWATFESWEPDAPHP